jgi:hypothetical protein
MEAVRRQFSVRGIQHHSDRITQQDRKGPVEASPIEHSKTRTRLKAHDTEKDQSLSWDETLTANEISSRSTEAVLVISFWSGNGTLKSGVSSWHRSLSTLFKLAGVHGHPYQFRHLFSVDLLSHGVPPRTVGSEHTEGLEALLGVVDTQTV